MTLIVHRFDVPHGPYEVLFTRPTTPGILTRAMFDNIIAIRRARSEYNEKHLEEYGELIQYAIPTGYLDYPFFPAGRSFRKTRRKPGSPSFESFFNANLGKWYR